VSEKDKLLTKNDVYRRRYVRVGVATVVTYTIEGEDVQKVGDSNDLGGGGIRLATKEDIPFGAVLLLRFPLPESGREVMARGRIVLSFYNAESKQFNHGVAFTQIDPKDQAEIVRYVASEVQRIALEEDEVG
jgi:c-di-GMP-binding flagellar brake protein YcgR